MRIRRAFGVVVEAACRFVEQYDGRRGAQLHREDERQPLAFGQVAGMDAVGDAGREPVEQLAGRDRYGAVGFRVGLVELVAHRLEIEQVGRRLGNEADERARLARGEAPWGPCRRPRRAPLWRLPDPCIAHSSDDLPDPLRPISAVTSFGREIEVDAADRDDVAVADEHVAGPQAVGRRAPHPGAPAAAFGRRWSRATVARARRASRTDNGNGVQPASRPSSTTGGATDVVANIVCGSSVGHGAVAGQVDDAVGVLHDPFEAVFGEHDGDAEVVHQAGDRGEHLFGRGRVERGGGLVEHEHARVGREHGADRDALLLAAGDLVQRPIAQLGQTKRSSVSSTRLRIVSGGHRELFHAVRELFFDDVGDEAGERILSDDADDIGQLARRMRRGVASVDGDSALEHAAGEVGDQAVDRAEQRRLARTGAPDDEAELAFVDAEVDVAQHRRRRVGVRDRDAVELDHAVTARRLVRGTRSSAGSVAARAAS